MTCTPELNSCWRHVLNYRFLPSGFQEHCVTLLELEEDKQPKAAQRRLEVCNACDMRVAREGCALALH